MSAKDSEPSDVTDEQWNRRLGRIKELEAVGLEWSHASGIADLEQRLELWQESWGDSLPFLIHGDFKPPTADIHFEELGITVYSEDVRKEYPHQPPGRAFCVLKAKVRVQQRNMVGILDATRRINILLGAFVLIGWGNGSCHWWSWLIHKGNGGAIPEVSSDEWKTAISSILRLPADARQRLEAALYWIREPGRSVLESNRNDDLRKFSAYWNAFECLVEAVNILRAPQRLSRNEKQNKINDFVAERSGKLTPGDITEIYQRVVNPGFVGKAAHALRVCFGDGAEVYMQECFYRQDRENRLYDIRNAINHGDIDAENMGELSRVEGRLSRLWIMLLGMMGRLVRFPCPLDPILPGDQQAH